jgi:predicted nucleic acid-binding protein
MGGGPVRDEAERTDRGDLTLVDTSAWVEFLRRTGSPAHRTVRRLIDAGAELAVTEPIVMEVLAGARSDSDAERLRHRMLAFAFLPLLGLPDYEASAAIHRTCRYAGESIRSHIDCLIAAVAIRARVPLLHADSDFDVIARHTPLRLEPLSS